MKKAWDRWGWVVALIMLTLFVLAMLYGGPAFGTVTEQRIREWVSALSGWAAVAAAYFTIRTMNEQRKEAIKFQAENVELEIMGKLALVRRLRRNCKAAKIGTTRLGVLGKEIEAGSSGVVKIFLTTAYGIVSDLDLNTVARFRDEIGWTCPIAFDLFKYMTECIPKYADDFYEKWRVDDDGWRSSLFNAVSDARGTDRRLDEIIEDCTRFEERWEKRISEAAG